MRCEFHNVEKTAEDALREDGFLPVLRWRRMLPTGGVADRLYTTDEAMSLFARRVRRRVAAAKAAKARRNRRGRK